MMRVTSNANSPRYLLTVFDFLKRVCFRLLEGMVEGIIFHAPSQWRAPVVMHAVMDPMV